jgi:predicted DNA-binding helix-hairpin-helix protein
MSDVAKFHLLTQQMHLEVAEDARCPQLTSRKKEDVYISQAMLPNGKRISLLKTLLTSVCERNCYYCPFRAERDYRRATFLPEEFAKIFMYMHHIGKVDGVFLSSGVAGGGVRTQDQLLDTASIMRYKYNYRGYLHLKIMPGADRAQVEQAMLLADRISINLEAPNTERLKRLSPEKQFHEELLEPIRWINEIRHRKEPDKAWKGIWPSTVTQFVVGGADETDIELLSITEKLHRQMGLARAYFSGFNPVPDTPLENKSPTPLIRQNRLYQASFLLRDYQFTMEELTFDDSGNLPLNTDPKSEWAKIHLLHQPIEINRATKEQLIRIPGIGPKSANLILTTRRDQRIHSLSSLAKLGIQARKAAPYILINGKRPDYQPVLI